MNKSLFLVFLILGSCSSNNADTSNDGEPEGSSSALTSMEGINLNEVVLPEGFQIEVFARVNNARSLALTESGTLFIGNRGGGTVYAIRDTDGDW